MKLSGDQITQNYYAGYQLALEIIFENEEAFGIKTHALNPEIVDLAQSVFGSEAMVHFLETTAFDRNLYRPVIEKEIKRLSKSFYPDVGKRRFLSLDKMHDELDYELADERTMDFPQDMASPSEPAIQTDEILDYLKNKISEPSRQYLALLFSRQAAQEREFSWNRHIFSMIDRSTHYLEHQLSEMRRLYPDGIPFDQEQISFEDALTDEQIIGCYKNVYLGIYPRYPLNFFQKDMQRRTAVITRFAIEQILGLSPLDVLRHKTARELADLGLRGVIRCFHYSLARLIRNAYPDLLMPWEEGRVDDGYWDNPDNRRLAVRWLIEDRLGISRQDISRAVRHDEISKKHFTENGLSYLYNQYFKSVSRALSFAYPDLKPWELGSVPNNFWSGEEGKKHIIEAVQWMIHQMGIPISGIPEAIHNKTLTRATFQQYGLSTVFERIFKKNLVQLLNTVFPNQFEIWEIGHVPPEYWDNIINGYRAALWVARKEKVPENKIAAAIRSGKLKKDVFSKYGLGSMFKKVFDADLQAAYLPYLLTYRKDISELLREAMLLSLIQYRIRQIQSQSLLNWLLRGIFFRPLTLTVERSQLRIYHRIRARIQQRMGDLSLRIMEQERE